MLHNWLISQAHPSCKAHIFPASQDDGGLEFVFPYGATLNAQKPAVPILSSGSGGRKSGGPGMAQMGRGQTVKPFCSSPEYYVLHCFAIFILGHFARTTSNFFSGWLVDVNYCIVLRTLSLGWLIYSMFSWMVSEYNRKTKKRPISLWLNVVLRLDTVRSWRASAARMRNRFK